MQRICLFVLVWLSWVVCEWVLFASPVLAHGGRLPFLFWGNFPRTFLGCQRAIGRAVGQCAVGTLKVLARCSEEHDSGAICTPDRQAELLRGLRIEALDTIDRFCSDRSAVQLGFLALVEAQADVSRACTEVERWARQELSDPRWVGGAVDQACRKFLARASVRVMRVSTENYRRFFDWLAIRFAPTSTRLRLLEKKRTEASRAAQKLAQIGTAHCESIAENPESVPQFLHRVVRQSECVVGAAYVQDAVHCDTPTPPGSPLPPTATTTPLPPDPTRTPETPSWPERPG